MISPMKLFLHPRIGTTLPTTLFTKYEGISSEQEEHMLATHYKQLSLIYAAYHPNNTFGNDLSLSKDMAKTEEGG